jgi:hypothetical protein
MHCQHRRLRKNRGNRCEIFFGVESKVRVEALIDRNCIGYEQQRVAVRRRFSRHLGSNVAIGAAAIVDHHDLFPRIRELLPYQSRQKV